jgi:hypothetical protein
MKSGEQKKGGKEKLSVFQRIGDAVIRLYSGYTREGIDEGVFWMDAHKYLAIDGKFADGEWIKTREAELLKESGKPFPDQRRKVYARARLEDYCRHQGVMEDGRMVARVPVFGTSRAQLAELGILADNFKKEKPREDDNQNFTVILPQDWSYGPVPNNPTLQNERGAIIRDGEGIEQAHVFYEHRLGELGDGGFRSFTRITPPQ